MSTTIPLDGTSVGPGSLIATCDPSDQSHIVEMFSDDQCGSQDGVFQATYVREKDECVQGIRNSDTTIFKVQCGDPMIHCSLPMDNPSLMVTENATGEEANVGSGEESSGGYDISKTVCSSVFTVIVAAMLYA